MTNNFQSLSNTIKNLVDTKKNLNLDESFLKPYITPPIDLNAQLSEAFDFESNQTSLDFNFSNAIFIQNNPQKFTVKQAKLVSKFLGIESISNHETLVFSLVSEKLEIQIQVESDGWTFSKYYKYMTGAIFDQLNLQNITFVFSTVSKEYDWDGNKIEISDKQNLIANLKILKNSFQILKYIESPSSAIISGPILLRANQETILYPDMDLKANLLLDNDHTTICAKKLKDLFIGFKIQKVKENTNDLNNTSLENNASPQYVQTPIFYLGAKVSINSDVSFNLEMQLNKDSNGFTFYLQPDPGNQSLFTPATLIELMGGNSYFEYVPSVLQKFLTHIGLEGLSMVGSLGSPPALNSLGVSLTSGTIDWNPFSDLTNGLDFTLNKLGVDWIILNPSSKPKNLITFSSEFTLLTDVFDGTFVVTIDNNLNITAHFNGNVNAANILEKLTNKKIGMPNGLDVNISDVDLQINTTAKSYAFSFVVDASVGNSENKIPLIYDINDNPLLKLENMQIELSAITSQSTKGSTNYSGSISGVIKLSDILALYVSLDYDGTLTPPMWTLSGSLTKPLVLSDIITKFYPSYTKDDYPSFIQPDFQVTRFDINATIPKKGTLNTFDITLPQSNNLSKSKYSISGTLEWKPGGILNELFDKPITATLNLNYDGNNANDQYSFSVTASTHIKAINSDISLGYYYGAVSPDGTILCGSENTASKNLWISWEGLQGIYNITEKKFCLKVKDWTVGGLIQSLVRTVGPRNFTLPPPWSLLDKISLDGLQIEFDIDTGRIAATYPISPISLGFATITGITLSRIPDSSKPKGYKITLALKTSSLIPGLQGQGPFSENGEDVEKLKDVEVPGDGEQLFDLKLLMLGQHIGIQGANDFKDTQSLIKALEKIPSTNTDSNPLQPTSNSKTTIVPKVPDAGQPYYNHDKNWLVAGHFGLFKVGSIDSIDCMFAFNDPDLYALRLAFNGDKIKILDGLSIDVLYKKVTDEVGVYQIEFVVPKLLRDMNLGALSITLPNIGIQIYTNGDYLIDVGFPYNQDFSRSFTIQAQIGPFPVMGSGGFYFGKLSSATAPSLPKVDGTFNPVIKFGLGIQIGLGKQLDVGILKAGFSITVFGILEGIIAPYHPPIESKLNQLKVKDLQNTRSYTEETYVWLRGTFGIAGKIFGTVDFAIIKASVNIEVRTEVQITFESCKDIPIRLSASVSIKVSIKIDLWIFSITFSFSFEAKISQDLTITNKQKDCAWCKNTANPKQYLNFYTIELPEKYKPLSNFDTKPTLSLYATPAFTVLSNEKSSEPESAFVFLLATDAPSDTSSEGGKTSFELMCEYLLPWVIGNLITSKSSKDELDLTEVNGLSVSRTDLASILTLLSNSDPKMFHAEDIVNKFLKPIFNVNVSKISGTCGQKNNEYAKIRTIFPPIPGLSLTFPDSKNKDNSISFNDYTTITTAYKNNLSNLFKKLAARVDEESGNSNNQNTVPVEDSQSLNDFVFEDYFLLIARQLIQVGIDTFNDYCYKLVQNSSLNDIQKWANDPQRKNHVTLLDIALPNLNCTLVENQYLIIPETTYVIQEKDTVNKIILNYAQWKIDALKLLDANMHHRIIKPNVPISIPEKSKTYLTEPGDSLQDIVDGLDMPLADILTDDPQFLDIPLFIPAAVLTIPEFNYLTVGSDKLSTIITNFGITLEDLIPINPDSIQFAKENTSIQIANLESLLVSDLWQVIEHTNHVGQIAGMVSRYQLHGMRLPYDAGMVLSENFLYPKTQKQYGLYQLTGQQFPTSKLSETENYSINLCKSSNLSWITFDEQKNTDSLKISLQDQIQLVNRVYDYVRGEKEGFSPTNLQINSAYDVSKIPKRYSTQNVTSWSPSSMDEVISITNASNSLASLDSTPSQIKPQIWEISSSLLRNVEQRQAALDEYYNSTNDVLSFLPMIKPQIVTTDLSTGSIETPKDVENFRFATRLDFQIKKLSSDVNSKSKNKQVSSTDANPSIYNYELLGPNPSDSILLYRLLSLKSTSEMISDMFLLYSEKDDSNLSSRSTDEYCSFITQTNLSTATNPDHPQVEINTSKKLPGIVNKIDFIKLLWELSTVRSGGYYFYYQASDNTSLPDSLFDSTGVATLTLLITYTLPLQSNSFSLHRQRLTNFINAMITTKSIDTKHSVMTLQSQSSVQDSLPIKITDDKTLQQLASLYGVGVGTFARLSCQNHSPIMLTTGQKIDISGICHQITPTESSNPDPLSLLAKKYSTTVDKITTLNPGVPVKLYSVFRIPTVTYEINKDHPASNTFDSISTYYGVSIDALAYSVRSVVGLIEKDFEILFDSQTFDIKPALGIGNVGIQINCDNLGPQNDPCQDSTFKTNSDYAKKYLSSLYTLLRSNYYDNGFFYENKISSLPFGPHANSNDNSNNINSDSSNLSPFHYDVAMGINSDTFNQNFNPAPESPPLLESSSNTKYTLPQKYQNPYMGVGTIAQMNLQWIDIFGNTIVTPFSNPLSDYGGPLNNTPVVIDYTDNIIGLSQWPNVKTFYSFQGDSTASTLKISLKFDTESYDADIDNQKAKNDYKIFSRIYFQLNQNYDSVNIPEYTGLGQAVSMSILNTLLDIPEQKLDADNQQNIRKFVYDCLEYLVDILNNNSPQNSPVTNITIPVVIDELTSQNIIPLSISIKFARHSDLCNPILRGITNGLSITTEIMPKLDDSDKPINDIPENSNVSLKTFATNMEKIFKYDDWCFKVGTGPIKPDQPKNNQSYSIWLVRMASQLNLSGLYYKIKNEPVFYSPKPLSTSVQSKTVKLYQYSKEKGLDDDPTMIETFTGADLNNWLKIVLRSIDKFLSSTYTAPSFILDKKCNSAFLERILCHKKSLANSIADSVESILCVDGSNDTKSKNAAIKKFYQSLLNEMSSAFNVSTITVFPVETNGKVSDDTAATRFYTQPVIADSITQEKNSNNDKNFSFSTSKIPIVTNNDSRMAFLFTAKNTTKYTARSINLNFKASHLEHNIRDGSNIKDGYQQSSWINFVNGPFDNKLDNSIKFPLLLRDLPVPPTVNSQIANSSIDKTKTILPSDLTKWKYIFDYSYGTNIHDEISITVQFNLKTNENSSMITPSKDIFSALAQFVTVYPEISEDLDKYLLKINAKSTIDDTDFKYAQNAISAFEQIIEHISANYDASQKTAELDLIGDESTHFIMKLRPESKGCPNAVIGIFLDSNNKNRHLIPKIFIESDKYRMVPCSPLPGSDASYRYSKLNDPTTFLTYDQAKHISVRSVCFEDLNVFTL